MNIAITTVQIPFITGGAELLAQNLKKELIKANHEVEIVTMPFIDNPLHYIEEHIIAARLMNINWSWGGRFDLCIGLKFPAYFMPHRNKVIWACHQHRAAYELFGTPYSNIQDNADGREIHSIVKNADEAYLPEAKRIYTIAKNVSMRLYRNNGLHSTPLYHPCPDMQNFYEGEFEDYILMPSRINVSKRQKLAIEAMHQVKGDLRLLIVGKADNQAVADEFKSFIKEQKLEKQIHYLDYVSNEDKLKLYANARAVLFIPLDEDYGYITLEAMAAGKPVITCTDSGGPLEFVVNEKSGFIVEPEPKAIAERIGQFNSTGLAREMGTHGRDHLRELNITWDNVVKELTRP